jgi:hypothetical protein
MPPSISTSTRDTPSVSAAQPVTGNEPAAFFTPLPSGMSTNPNGA